MVELTTRITNLTTAIVILFTFGYEGGIRIENLERLYKSPMLRERPGLQNITYTADYDHEGCYGKVPSMAGRALQQVDANVNILLDFLNDLTIIHPLYLGQKPTTAMIDKRTAQKFAYIKANKDKKTLKFDIYSTLPML